MISFSELCAVTGLAKSTTCRLLLSLERNGLICRDEAGAYKAGELFQHFAWRSGREADIAQVAKPYLAHLCELTRETINLGITRRGVVEQIAQVDGAYLLGATNWVGRPVPLHASALGKVLLAFGACKLAPGRLERCSERTITSRSDLAAELVEVRRRGYAIADEELEPGLVAIAAPVFKADDLAAAAVSVSGPNARITPRTRGDYAAACAAAAMALSKALGHRSRKEGAA